MMKRDVAAGFTLVELLVSLLLVSVVLVAVSTTFFNTTRRSMDSQVVMETEERVRATLDFMAYDLRMAGSGMPLGQASFTPANLALGDAPLPVLTSASQASIQIRLTETGQNTVLASDYTPSSTDLTFSVFDSSDFEVGDTLYISDMPRGGAEGLRAVVTAVSGDDITIDDDFLASFGGAFSAGSLVARVSTVTYTSASDWSGITRTTEEGTEVIAPNSTFTLRYFNGSGTELGVPMDAATITNALTSVLLTVTVRSLNEQRNGGMYTAVASQRIAFRNMNINR